MLHGTLRSAAVRARLQRWVRALGLSVGVQAGWPLEHASAAEGGLKIETGSPDALCPELESTRAAVSRRLGELVVPGGGAFVARYTIGHAPAGSPRDFVRLELLDAGGAVLLARDLPLDGESCGTMSEVIALVLDRYFRALLGGDAAPPAAEVPALDTAAAPLPQAAALQALSPESAAAEDAAPQASLPAARLDLGPEHLDELALDLGFRGWQQPALGVRATFELLPYLYAGTALHVSLYQRREALRDGAQVASRDAVWRAHLAWAWALQGLRIYLGPGLGASIERASGAGLDQSSTGFRGSWWVAADAGAIWSLRDAWTLHVSGALDVHVPGSGGRFYVENGEVLRPSALRGWLGVGIGYDL